MKFGKRLLWEKNRFDDVKSLRKFLHVTEEETESTKTSNNAKKYV